MMKIKIKIKIKLKKLNKLPINKSNYNQLKKQSKMISINNIYAKVKITSFKIFKKPLYTIKINKNLIKVSYHKNLILKITIILNKKTI